MNYIAQLNAFDDSSRAIGLPAFSQVIYYKLLGINNRVQWAETFMTTNQRLMFEAGIANEKTLIRYRNILKQHGFIEFVPGKKGTPTRYHIYTLYDEQKSPVKNTVLNTVNNTGYSTVNRTVKTTVNRTAIYKHKHKQDDDDDNAREVSRSVVAYENDLQLSPTPRDIERINALTDDFGEEWVVQAIHIAREKNAKSVRYIEVILEGWRDTGSNRPWEEKKHGPGFKNTVAAGGTNRASGGTDWSRYDGA